MNLFLLLVANLNFADREGLFFKISCLDGVITFSDNFSNDKSYYQFHQVNIWKALTYSWKNYLKNIL